MHTSLDRLRNVLGYSDTSHSDSGFEERIDPKYYPLIILDDIKVYEKMRYDLEKIRLNLDNKKLQLDTENNIILSNILKELKDEADEGQVLDLNGTVSSSNFTFIETAQNPEHPVKAFDLTNDGPNSITFAWNVTQSGIEPSTEDITSTLTRFRTLNANDNVRFSFNRRVIKNIAIRAIGGNSTYKIWLIW